MQIRLARIHVRRHKNDLANAQLHLRAALAAFSEAMKSVVIASKAIHYLEVHDTLQPEGSCTKSYAMFDITNIVTFKFNVEHKQNPTTHTAVVLKYCVWRFLGSWAPDDRCCFFLSYRQYICAMKFPAGARTAPPCFSTSRRKATSNVAIRSTRNLLAVPYAKQRNGEAASPPRATIRCKYLEVENVLVGIIIGG